jgi:hypothetical protein
MAAVENKCLTHWSVCQVLVVEHVMRMRRIILSSVTGPAYNIRPLYLKRARFF